MPMRTDEFLSCFQAARASAILRTPYATAAAPAMQAAIDGGFRVVEITLSTPKALELVDTFARQKELVVGVGTVLTVEEAQAAVGAGARFLVSPVTDEAIIEEASRLGVVMIPGAATPTEMLRAYRAGAPLQKLFPEVSIGPNWVKQLLGPMPFLRIVPTSGVTLENAAAYLQAGAFAVGFVNSLFDPADLAAGRFDAITQRARKMLAAVGK